MKPFKGSLNQSQLLEQYFNDYFDVLHRYAYTILKDNDEAKDAVQSVFVQLWNKKDLLDIQQSPRSYLYVATHNHCLNLIRSRRIRQKHYVTFIAEGQPSAVKTDPLELKDLRNEVLSAMDSLPEKCREIFYKSRFEEKTYGEIAEELQISVKTVETQMGKALRILRKILSNKSLFLILYCVPFTELINLLP